MANQQAAMPCNTVEAKGILEVQRGTSGAATSGPEPDPTWQPKTGLEFLARGYVRIRSHKYPQAEADAEDALQRMPENAAAHFLHGRAAYEDKEYATAINDFSKVIEQKPDWPEAYRHRGLAYSQSGAAERAQADLQSALKLDPSLTSAYNNQGHAFMALGQLELAKQNLDWAIELEPDFVLACENRAKLLSRREICALSKTSSFSFWTFCQGTVGPRMNKKRSPKSSRHRRIEGRGVQVQTATVAPST